MNNLPPLPLRDGAFFIDNSQLETMIQCPRRHEYASLRKRVPVAGQDALLFGSAAHEVLALRYRRSLHHQVTPEIAQEQVALLEKLYQEHPVGEESWRTLSWAEEIFVRRYNLRYGIEPFKIATLNGEPVIEMPFAFRLSQWSDIPIYYCGKIDLCIQWDGQYFALDHKSTSMLGESFWESKRVSPQFIGYCYALWKCTGIRPGGFIINAIRTKTAPAKPRNGLDAWWEETYGRDRQYVSQDMMDEWLENTLYLVHRWFDDYERGYQPTYRQNCQHTYGRCPFFDVCTTPKPQRDQMLASQYFQDNTWSPLATLSV